jgi:hypothetical protein
MNRPPSKIAGDRADRGATSDGIVTQHVGDFRVRCDPTHSGRDPVLGLLSLGSILLAIGFVGAYPGVVAGGSWVLVASAAAFCTAGAIMLAGAFDGRTVLPPGEYRAAANVPGRTTTRAIAYPAGMSGSTVGR